jgi:hypothetical protein
VQDDEIVQINPSLQIKKDVGIIGRSFTSETKNVNVYFTDRNIYEGVTYNASIVCSGSDGSVESFRSEITPNRPEMYGVLYYMLYLKDISPWLSLMIFFGILLYVVFLVILPPPMRKVLILLGIGAVAYLLLESYQVI